MNKTGVFGEGTAHAGADVDANANVYAPKGGRLHGEASAGVTAEATAKGKATWDEVSSEASASAGARASASA